MLQRILKWLIPPVPQTVWQKVCETALFSPCCEGLLLGSQVFDELLKDLTCRRVFLVTFLPPGEPQPVAPKTGLGKRFYIYGKWIWRDSTLSPDAIEPYSLAYEEALGGGL